MSRRFVRGAVCGAGGTRLAVEMVRRAVRKVPVHDPVALTVRGSGKITLRAAKVRVGILGAGIIPALSALRTTVVGVAGFLTGAGSLAAVEAGGVARETRSDRALTRTLFTLRVHTAAVVPFVPAHFAAVVLVAFETTRTVRAALTHSHRGVMSRRCGRQDPGNFAARRLERHAVVTELVLAVT